MLKTNCRL